MREEVIQEVVRQKIIAIVRGVYGDDCLRLAQALCAGGVKLLEVTFDHSHPEDFARTSDTVRRLRDAMGAQMRFGAGTVTSLKLLDLAEEAGASFIVSPDVNADLIRRTTADGLVSIPGALTPTEALRAHDCGADFVKIFPASALGAAYVRAIRAPLSHVKMLAVGGINENNLADYLQAGCVGAGIGGNLVNRAWIAEKKFSKLTALAEQLVETAKK